MRVKKFRRGSEPTRASLRRVVTEPFSSRLATYIHALAPRKPNRNQKVHHQKDDHYCSRLLRCVSGDRQRKLRALQHPTTASERERDERTSFCRRPVSTGSHVALCACSAFSIAFCSLSARLCFRALFRSLILRATCADAALSPPYHRASFFRSLLIFFFLSAAAMKTATVDARPFVLCELLREHRCYLLNAQRCVSCSLLLTTMFERRK